MPRMCARYLSLCLLANFGSIFAEGKRLLFSGWMEYFRNHRFLAPRCYQDAVKALPPPLLSYVYAMIIPN
jgi:hypothetical protein